MSLGEPYASPSLYELCDVLRKRRALPCVSL